MTELIATTPPPPYWAVIFTSVQTDELEGYAETAQRMMELAARSPGFLGVESAREDVGITVSYWADLDCIREWKRNAEHLAAQANGRRRWYQSFRTRVALVERDYGFSRSG